MSSTIETAEVEWRKWIDGEKGRACVSASVGNTELKRPKWAESLSRRASEEVAE